VRPRKIKPLPAEALDILLDRKLSAPEQDAALLALGYVMSPRCGDGWVTRAEAAEIERELAAVREPGGLERAIEADVLRSARVRRKRWA